MKTARRTTRLPGETTPSVRTADAERTERVLRSSRRLFLKHGYAGASLKGIVAEVGGSYRDIYQKLGDKEALFRRVVGELCEEVITPLIAASAPVRDKTLSTEKALFSIGRLFLEAILSTRALALHRLIVSEAIRFPELPDAFMRMGPKAAYGALADFIQACFADEGLSIDDPAVVARLYLDMITADFQLRALTGSKITRIEIDQRICRANSIFIAGIRKTSKRINPEST
jgi:AcrR family transcriptional regulator